jgi:hypothetical protein
MLFGHSPYRRLQMRTSRRYLHLFTLAGAAMVSACGSTVEGSSTGSVIPEIVGVARGPVGYVVSIKLTNADTGTIAYGPDCPGQLEILRQGRWVPSDSTASCRNSATTVDAGKSRLIELSSQPLASGDRVRFTASWIWFNGQPTTQRSISSVTQVP